MANGLGIVDQNAISNAIAQTPLSLGKYKTYSDEDRFQIGKYASEHRPAAAVRKFKAKFRGIKKVNIEVLEKSMKKLWKRTGVVNKYKKINFLLYQEDALFF